MSAAARAVTNKQNAQHSTGPRTEEGKRQSSLNSLRHGLTGQTVVLPTEDAEAYARFRATIQSDFAPKGVAEEILAQTICDTQWRLERARNMEANLLTIAHHEVVPNAFAQIEDPQHRGSMVEAYGYLKRERVLHNLQLQEARLQRTLFRAMKELRELQAAREALRQAKLAEAVLTRAACQQANLPFNPTDLGFVFTAAELDREAFRLKALDRSQLRTKVA